MKDYCCLKTMKRRYRGTLANDPPGLFCNCHMTKTELSKALNVDRGTVKNWDEIAFWKLPDYRAEYPKREDGTYDREAPLSPYQVWVVSLIGRYMTNMRRAEKVKQEIKAYPHRFSVNQFKLKFAQVYTEETA